MVEMPDAPKRAPCSIERPPGHGANAWGVWAVRLGVTSPLPAASTVLKRCHMSRVAPLERTARVYIIGTANLQSLAAREQPCPRPVELSQKARTAQSEAMANMMAPGGFATTKVCRHDDCADERCRRMEAHDALLDPCCAKDQKERRRASKWMAQLRAADPARKALDARRGAVDVAPLPEYERRPAALPLSARQRNRNHRTTTRTPIATPEFLDELENDNELMEKMRSRGARKRVHARGRRRASWLRL